MAVESINTIKSYLTEGKYPTASELVDIIDTLVSIGQNSGGSASGSYLELVPDLDTYTEASVGKMVKYKGQTNNKYTRGWDYELTETQEVVTVPSGVFAVTVSNAPDSKFNKKFYQTNDTIKYIVPDTSHEYIHEGDGTLKIGDYVYKTSSCTTNSTLAVRSKIVDIYTNEWNEHICQLDNNTSFEINPNITAFNTLIFESQDGLKIGLASSDVRNNLYSASGFVFFYSDSEYGRCTISCNTQESEISYNKTVKSWQPIIMPSSNNIQTDVELSSSSHYPVENATLYDELRVEEAGSVLSVNSTNYPIVELDATDFDSIVYTGASDTDFTFKVIPTLDSNKAYIIKNANFEESINDYNYSFSNQGTFIVKFQPSGNLGQYTSIAIGHNDPDAYNYYQTEGTEFNKWLSIPATYQFNVTDNGGYDNDTTIPYYGTSYEDGGSSTITELTNATETTGSASVIKSLKAKVMELEAQIAQISTQLQNIASN